MDKFKLIEKLVHSYLMDEKLPLGPLDGPKLINEGYLEKDYKTPTTKSIEYYLNRYSISKSQLPLSVQIDIDNTLKGADDLNILFSKMLKLLGEIKGSAGFLV